jgi:serine/threonine protein kinase
MHDSGATTPPSTPTHAKSSSTSSDFLSSLSDLRRGDSPSSPSGRPSLDDSARPGSTELLVFPHHLSEYHIQADGEGRKRPIGVGAWSDVYLATPSLPHLMDLSPGSNTSLPLTPVRSRGSSKGSSSLPSIPPLYAIKVPGSTSAKAVLNAEARILSYLSRFPDADQHVVPFYGQDTRTGALVLKAMDGTLEDWIQNDLNALATPSRAQKLAAIFPSIALSLINSLIWMQDKDCIHADIKPSNILVSSSSSATPTPVFSDFSSTILTRLSTDDAAPPVGAGTWEFLDPSLLSSFSPATPCAATDLYSLAITLLFLILGASPYEGFKHNKFQQREMIKTGCPLECLQHGDQSVKNQQVLKALGKDLGFDVAKWMGKVLVKSKEKRVGVEAWREELVQGMARM